METKMFEIRDRGTCIAAMAIQFGTEHENERRLFSYAGFGENKSSQGEYILLIQLGPKVEAQYDPFGWSLSARTMFEAHRFISEYFEQLQTGDVIDVQFILGETPERKKTDLAMY